MIEQLAPGEEVIITRDDQPVGRLTGASHRCQSQQPGNCVGMLTIDSDDEHLKDFEAYMP
ncbi:MAG TPA: hypothetical protein VIL46_03060 [Gemmataceae bacterium]